MRRMQVCYRLWSYCQSVDCMIPDSVSFSYIHSLQTLTCAASRYENPVITATSRDSIGDIRSLSQYLSELDAPKPTSLLRNLLGLARIPTDRESWFQISRMWTEVDDVCENESFGESATGCSPMCPIFWISQLFLVRRTQTMHCGAYTQYTPPSRTSCRTLFGPHERRPSICSHVRGTT